jgi:hypothetical protein
MPERKFHFQDSLIHPNVGRRRKRMRKTIILEDTSGKKAVF